MRFGVVLPLAGRAVPVARCEDRLVGTVAYLLIRERGEQHEHWALAVVRRRRRRRRHYTKNDAWLLLAFLDSAFAR